MNCCYRAFGLVIQSEFAVKALAGAEVSPDTHADVRIVWGKVAVQDGVTVSDMVITTLGASMILNIAQVGVFQVTAGREIVVEPEVQATQSQVDAYLLGSVFGALLHQRGILPLHGNGVVSNGQVYMFCGDSGAGKSTLAAYFQSRGFSLLTDDLCAVTDAGPRLAVWPGIPRLKLWGDALALLDQPTDGLTPVPWSKGKFELPMRAVSLGGPYPIAAIYHLRQADDRNEAGIHRVTGLQAINVVTANIYRRRLADLAGRAPEYLAQSVKIARTIPTFRVNRCWGLDCFHEEVAAMIAHMASIEADPQVK
jgi:hypothetical protein